MLTVIFTKGSFIKYLLFKMNFFSLCKFYLKFIYFTHTHLYHQTAKTFLKKKINKNMNLKNNDLLQHQCPTDYSYEFYFSFYYYFVQDFN